MLVTFTPKLKRLRGNTLTCAGKSPTVNGSLTSTRVLTLLRPFTSLTSTVYSPLSDTAADSITSAPPVALASTAAPLRHTYVNGPSPLTSGASTTLCPTCALTSLSPSKTGGCFTVNTAPTLNSRLFSSPSMIPRTSTSYTPPSSLRADSNTHSAPVAASPSDTPLRLH